MPLINNVDIQIAVAKKIQVQVCETLNELVGYGLH